MTKTAGETLYPVLKYPAAFLCVATEICVFEDEFKSRYLGTENEALQLAETRQRKQVVVSS